MERDDLIVNDSYALNAHHSEEEGVAIRKKIYMVTVILSVITAIEVGMLNSIFFYYVSHNFPLINIIYHSSCNCMNNAVIDDYK